RLKGVDHYLGPHGSVTSKREYDRLVAEWLADDRRRPVGIRHLSVSELILRYLKFSEGYYRKNGRPTSAANNVKLALRPLRALYGSTPVRELGPLAVKTVRHGWITEGITRGEINKRVGRITRCIRWAVEN